MLLYGLELRHPESDEKVLDMSGRDGILYSIEKTKVLDCTRHMYHQTNVSSNNKACLYAYLHSHIGKWKNQSFAA